MEHTEYYQLSLWDADDRIMREDFNDNNAKLDAALKAANDRIDTLGTSKANAAALGAETTARENADTALGGRIDSEAQARENADSAEATARANADSALQNNINAETAARAAALAAVNANLGAHGHNCRIVWGSYTGNGNYSSANPNTLTFDFHPLLVMIYNGAPTNIYHPAPLILMRPLDKARSPESSGNIVSTVFMNITWLENGVKWYAGSRADQLNETHIYYYVVLGYDKAAEEA